jgi:hypothetical protein
MRRRRAGERPGARQLRAFFARSCRARPKGRAPPKGKARTCAACRGCAAADAKAGLRPARARAGVRAGRLTERALQDAGRSFIAASSLHQSARTPRIGLVYLVFYLVGLYLWFFMFFAGYACCRWCCSWCRWLCRHGLGCRFRLRFVLLPLRQLLFVFPQKLELPRDYCASARHPITTFTGTMNTTRILSTPRL